MHQIEEGAEFRSGKQPSSGDRLSSREPLSEAWTEAALVCREGRDCGRFGSGGNGGQAVSCALGCGTAGVGSDLGMWKENCRSWNMLTPHPGLLPVEGRGSRDGGLGIFGSQSPRSRAMG